MASKACNSVNDTYAPRDTSQAYRSRMLVAAAVFVVALIAGSLWLRSMRDEGVAAVLPRQRLAAKIVNLPEARQPIHRVAAFGLAPEVFERIVEDAQKTHLFVQLSRPKRVISSQIDAERYRDNESTSVLWAKNQPEHVALFLTTAAGTQQFARVPSTLAAAVAVAKLAERFSRSDAAVEEEMAKKVTDDLHSVERLQDHANGNDAVQVDDVSLLILIANWYSIVGYQEGEQRYLNKARIRLEHALEVTPQEEPLQQAKIHIQLGDLLRKIARWQPNPATAQKALYHLNVARSQLSSPSLAGADTGAARAKEAMSRAILQWQQGGRAIDTAKLNDAIKTYNKALPLYREDALNTARVNSNIGMVEYDLAIRTITDETLNDALQHYYPALKVFQEKRYDVKVGNTQQAIGLAHGELARRRLLEGDIVAAEQHIDKATAAYQAAVKVRTGRKYAVTLMNYSMLVIEIARWNNDPEEAKSALSFLRKARGYFRTDQHPEDISKIDHYIGVALTVLAVVTQTSEPAQQALAAFQSALSLRDKASDPFLWSETKIEEGYASFMLGITQRNATSLCGALPPYDAALKEIRAAVVTPEQRQQSAMFQDANRRRRIAVEQLVELGQTEQSCAP